MARFTSYFDPNAPDMVLKSLFYKYDKDGSGDLNHEELEKLFIDDLGLTAEQAKTYSLLLDADGSNTVCFDEFKKWLRSGEQFKLISNAEKSRYNRLQKAIEVFQRYDVDGNQSLEREEFKKMYCDFGGNMRKVDRVIARLDKDGNGQISFPEFYDSLRWDPVE